MFLHIYGRDLTVISVQIKSSCVTASNPQSKLKLPNAVLTFCSCLKSPFQVMFTCKDSQPSSDVIQENRSLSYTPFVPSFVELFYSSLQTTLLPHSTVNILNSTMIADPFLYAYHVALYLAYSRHSINVCWNCWINLPSSNNSLLPTLLCLTASSQAQQGGRDEGNHLKSIYLGRKCTVFNEMIRLHLFVHSFRVVHDHNFMSNIKSLKSCGDILLFCT